MIEKEDSSLFNTTFFGPLQAICRAFKDESIPDICK
ncbi:unnamed protein product [Paramecium octaurelia]|uniref:Uncharacterized protein n=1 Tax=Paramecium octaurelia TaxID=43137 RepID=A0A8S1WHT9_PAROT|nr:unnamed protein product [Paramecium octaurelia]